jgi:quercetin dioxygenase-like cupin family protein
MQYYFMSVYWWSSVIAPGGITVCFILGDGAVVDDASIQRTKGWKMDQQLLRFVTKDNIQVEELPWGPHDWLCRPGMVEAEQLLLVRVHMPPGKAHQFHHHPALEEIIYVLEGKAEQWVEQDSRILEAGDVAHIPIGVVHGTYNPFETTLRFLAILGPAKFEGPALVDVCTEEPWCKLKEPVIYKD